MALSKQLFVILLSLPVQKLGPFSAKNRPQLDIDYVQEIGKGD